MSKNNKSKIKSQAYARNYRNKVMKESLGIETEPDSDKKVYHGEGIANYNGEQVVKHVVPKRKSTRVAMRILGAVFIIGAIAIIWWGMSGLKFRILKMAIGIFAMAYGFSLVRTSFKKSAYDSTYLFGNDGMTVLQRKSSRFIDYKALTDVKYIKPDPNMEYYILKLSQGKVYYVLPFAGSNKKIDAIYEFLMKKVDLNEKEDSCDSKE